MKRSFQSLRSLRPCLPLLVALLLGSAPGADARAEIHVTDDSGRTVRLARPAQRIVTLAPHMAETLYAAGAGERLVGTVEFSDYPPEAQKVRRVGGYSRVDLETVAALKPDLVIGWESGNAPATLDALRALGLTVYVSQPDRIEDVAREIERFGQLAGTESVAQPKAAELRRRQAALQREYAGRPTVRVFYQIWKQPLATIGGKQIISSVIRLCGGENVFAAQSSLAPTVSVEAVIAANPEAIVASGMDAARPEWLDDWKRWPTIAAVARDNLFFVPPELIQRHTPRLVDGAEILCRQLESARQRRSK